jgi:diadenosine tetraphosphate (Ap4A) HIT family hydrolase/ribosomal protein S18 acetylase RimI-like enzyme
LGGDVRIEVSGKVWHNMILQQDEEALREMLIRWAAEQDLDQWIIMATEVSPIFRHPADMGRDPEFIEYAKSKSSKFEALTAVDYMSGANIGFIGFSRTYNRITWFGVSEKHRNKGVGSRLLKTALRQLDTNREITVTTFRDSYAPGAAARIIYGKFGFTECELTEHNGLPRSLLVRPPSVEKRGGSFHYRYPEFIKGSQKEFCPPCNNEPMPDGQIDIVVTDKICVGGEYPGQGRLFGKCHVMPIEHYFHFEDMPADEMIDFMSEVQRVGKALRKVTGAEKINYEMHSNSVAHLHIHLFPRYLDDDFPSAPIDYRESEPAPYESYDEYLWFVERMREELAT